ncbi:hypothetical protein CGCVW01_v011654 [Colletotrichum viniferum]|nr:hypothetical protein CGCVW01_v011654 [Colletotrichum viniferum]
MDTANTPNDGDSFPERKPESDCNVIAALIKRCEQSLKTLVVRRMFPIEKTDQRLSLSSQDINLRSLRTLDLSDCVEVGLTASRAMLCPSLRHLSMPWKWDESFLSCETLRNLETLVIPFLKETPRKPSTVGPLMKFLNRHPHIKKLFLGLGTDVFIDKRLLPCLSNDLTRLKRLAISRDTYPVPFDVAEPEYYYEMRIADPEDLKLAEKRSWINELKPIDVNEAHEIWEYTHQYKMFKEAEKYAEVIPTLEWVYCGEWPMKFVDGPVYEDGLWDGQTTPWAMKKIEM